MVGGIKVVVQQVQKRISNNGDAGHSILFYILCPELHCGVAGSRISSCFQHDKMEEDCRVFPSLYPHRDHESLRVSAPVGY